MPASPCPDRPRLSLATLLVCLAVSGCTSPSPPAEPAPPPDEPEAACVEKNWFWRYDAPTGEWTGTLTRSDGTTHDIGWVVLADPTRGDPVIATRQWQWDPRIAYGTAENLLSFQGLFLVCEDAGECQYDPDEMDPTAPWREKLSAQPGQVVLLANANDGSCPDSQDTYGRWALHAVLDPVGDGAIGEVDLVGAAEIGDGCGETVPGQTAEIRLSYVGERVRIDWPEDPLPDEEEDDEEGEEKPPPLAELALLAVKAQYEPYTDLSVLAAETTTDLNGCETRRWELSEFPHYVHEPISSASLGFTLVDVGQPDDEVVEDRPRHLFLQADAAGRFQLAGLGWFLARPTGFPAHPEPELFGIPMDGLWDSVYPSQPPHYATHAWLWLTSPDNDYGWFGYYNPAMQPPSWYHDYVYHGLGLDPSFNPTIANAEGYAPPGDCLQGEVGDIGYPRVRSQLVGALDPDAPDTLLYDGSGELLGLQWTVPDDGTGPPILFQQTLHGPDTDGNYTLRVWLGRRFNPGGFFHPEHLTFSCDEQPVQCPD